MPLCRWPISVTLTFLHQLTKHICIVIQYGIIFPVTLPKVGRFSIYKRKSLELWLVHKPEIQAEVYYRFFQFHANKHFH
jgi:hypothetical protein